MIISHKHKFIFIKTAKVGGTSIELFLFDHLGKEDVFPPFYTPEETQLPQNYRGLFNPCRELYFRRKINPNLKINGSIWTLQDLKSKRKFFESMPAWQIQTRVKKDIWDEYFKFTIERNPWDKVISRYFHSKSVYEPKYKRELAVDNFLDYLESRLETPWVNQAWGSEAPYNFPRYTNPVSGNVMVDRIIKYENLDDELCDVFEKFEIPYSGFRNYRAKGSYRKNRSPYNEFLNASQIQRISRIFNKEIELLGYNQ